MEIKNIEAKNLVAGNWYDITWYHKHRKHIDTMEFRQRGQNLFYFRDRSGEWLIVHYKFIVEIK